MHIVFVSNYAPPYQGGMQFVMKELSLKLTELGHRVTIIASNIGIQYTDYQDQKNLTVIGLPVNNFLEKHGFPYPLFHPVTLIQTLRRVLCEADVVHLHGTLYLSCLAAAWLNKQYRVRMVLTEHVGIVEQNSPFLQLVQRLMFETLGRFCCYQTDVVAVLNERVAHEIKPLLRDRNQLVKVPNGVDTDLFHPVSWEQKQVLKQKWGINQPTLLFAGRIVPKKGVELLLEAARNSLFPYELIIAGKGGLQTEIANVRYVGVLDQQTLAELYQAVDLFILPSIGEGFPLVVQEAMAAGLPVVVTDDPTYREYLDESVAIFVERTVDSINGGIESLFINDEKRKAMGDAARTWAKEKYDWNVTVSTYLKLYDGQPVE